MRRQHQINKTIGNNPSRRRRTGTTAVEMAFVLPVFGIFMAGIVEFGHVYMTINTLNSAARKAARIGVADGVSTDAVIAEANTIISEAFNTTNVSVTVKNAAAFDQSGVDAASLDLDALPTAKLNETEPRQLFLVRISVPYNEIALLPPFWAKNLTLTGQAVMRHE